MFMWMQERHRFCRWGQNNDGKAVMRILVVEDDQSLASQLKSGLTAAGYVVDHCGDGEEGHYLGESEPYDAIVLDLGLPMMDGLSVLKKWRNDGHTMPVLVLTARDSWREKVEGFDAGADDYLAKPFELEELVARLKALIRRSSGIASPTISYGDILLDTRSARVTLKGSAVDLTAQEYKILAYFMHHYDKIVSRTELTEHIYDQNFDLDSNTIEVFIGRLRRKLGDDVIKTERGLGYRFVAGSDAH